MLAIGVLESAVLVMILVAIVIAVDRDRRNRP